MTRRYLAIMIAIVSLLSTVAYVSCGGKDKVVLEGKDEDRLPPEKIPPPPKDVNPKWLTIDEREDAMLRFANTAEETTRFIDLSDQFNEGVSDNELEQTRLAIQKALNHLSNERDLVKATPINPEGTILAVDIEDLGWTKDTWCLIEEADPFKFESFTTRGEILKQLLETKRPWINADIFIRTATNSDPKFNTYYRVMGFPGDEKSFLNLIGTNLQKEFDDEDVSLVSVQNPIITLGKNRQVARFDSRNGEGWYTSDFNQNFNDQKNLTLNPFPPEARSNLTYRHDAREYIVPLANGCHGYFLSAGDGSRANDAPTDVVIDVNSGGLSQTIILQKCVKCHAGGIIPVIDEGGRSIANNPNIGAEDKTRGRIFFKSQADINKDIQSDNEAYISQCLRPLGIDPNVPDFGNKLVDKLDKGLNAKQIAAKYNIPEAEFIEKLRGSGIALNEVTTLLNGGSIDVTKFIDVNQLLLVELNVFREDDLD